MKAVAKATMSVYDGCAHRITGLPNPEKASVEESLDIFDELLTRLQCRGVKPGTKLKITIETIPSKKKKR